VDNFYEDLFMQDAAVALVADEESATSVAKKEKPMTCKGSKKPTKKKGK